MNKTLTLLCSLILCLTALGQTRHFYTSEKLSSNLITCICQDQTGYIWIGTEYGLNRYDGYRFTNYLHDAGDAASLLSNNITSLFVDKKGNLWVGTGIGLVRYDEATGRFERIALPSSGAPRINDIVQEDDRHLLIGTAGYGLFRVDIASRRSERVENYTRGDMDYFNHILIDADGNFWKGGSGSDFTCRKPDKTILHYDSPYGPVTDFVNYQGGVLMVCQHGLLFCRDGQILPDFIDLSVLGRDDVLFRSALCDAKGNLFIGTLGKGLCWLPQGSHKLRRYEYPSSSFDLNTSNVWALFEDNQENLWVGCLKRGLLLLPRHEPQFSTWSLSAQNVKIGGSVTSFCQGDHGMTWVAVQNNGIYGFDSHGNMVAHPAAPPKTYAIYRDKGGGYWIGDDDGLYSYQPATGAYTKVVGVESDYINVITDDGRGRLFFSTYSKGFCIYDIRTKAFRRFSMHDSDPRRGRLHNDWVMVMMPDSRGLLWIGTSSNLSCYDPVKDTFKSQGWEVQLEGKTVTSLYEDTRHRVIIGTDVGLFLYNRQRAAVEPYPGAEALDGKVISGIEQDQFGDLWCSTTMGIWQYQRDKQRWVTHVNGNGLMTREYVPGLAMQQPAGDIFFGISDGVTVFHPAALRENRASRAEVHLTGLLVGGTPVNSASRHFSLSYIDNTFSMEFSLFNYANAENVIFEYRLNGSKEWAQTPVGGNVIPFNHIQPGSYTLEVRAYDNGAYTDSQVYYLVIRAPWYRSAWAYLIYIIAGLGLLGYLGYSWRRQTRQQLDEEKMKFLINATHDIRSPLTLIMSPLHKLLRRDFDPETKAELKTIAHNAQRIQNLVNQILDIRKIDKQQMKLQCQQTDMVQYVGNILKSYDYTARERNIDFTYKPAIDKLDVWLDRSALDKIVDNLLSNAFKYTYDGGAIEVRVAQGDHNTALLQVVDTGMGIKGDAARLFDRFYSTSRSLHIEGTGIGLNLCKMMVEMHHGTIEAANRSDAQGSVFTVHLPLGKAHLTGDEILIPEQKEQSQRQKAQSCYKVLVVDDDAEIGNYISQELGGYYHITAVTSGREALRELLSADTGRQYDLVVSDVMMPEMDGFTLLRMIKTNMNLSHIPVVMLTSKSDVANRLEGLERGADAFLAKPFDMDELHVVINNLISKNLRLKGKYSGTQQQKDKVVETNVKGNDEILMERIMKAINAHLSDSDFNVEMLTREVGISRAQLHRKMKEMTGLPISEFIRNIRLEQAVRLLKEQKINVTQVAYTVGFSNLAHFSTVFRKQFGVSPTEYIEQNSQVETKAK
jgi:signal transduction histidine kinase/ligand-binding sensor domain-containing protein/DNA-binding response OmpR family regulator